jgi:hypothetical protein
VVVGIYPRRLIPAAFSLDVLLLPGGIVLGGA